MRRPGVASPFSGTPLIAIVTCVALAALCGAVPFLSDYARRQDEALDDRQRGLDSLSRTVAASAEQISIAANGLHEITELAQRNLKAADQLPQKLQEKIATFKAQLDSAGADDREELEKEVATLRAAEGERLESAADKMAKAIAELTRLEASAQKHLAASTTALDKATASLGRHGKENDRGSRPPKLRRRQAEITEPSAGPRGVTIPLTPARHQPERAANPPSEAGNPEVQPAANHSDRLEHARKPTLRCSRARFFLARGFDFKAGSAGARNRAKPPRQGKRLVFASTAAAQTRASKTQGRGRHGDAIRRRQQPNQPRRRPRKRPSAKPATAAVAIGYRLSAIPSQPPETVETNIDAKPGGERGVIRWSHAPAGHRLHRHRQSAFHPRRRTGPELGKGCSAPIRVHREMALGNVREATGAVQFKLYKNDDTECVGLGRPGRSMPASNWKSRRRFSSHRFVTRPSSRQRACARLSARKRAAYQWHPAAKSIMRRTLVAGRRVTSGRVGRAIPQLQQLPAQARKIVRELQHRLVPLHHVALEVGDLLLEAFNAVVQWSGLARLPGALACLCATPAR